MRQLTAAVVGMTLLVGCTSTASHVSTLRPPTEPLNLARARVAVFAFSDAPGQPETGRLARDVATGILVDRFGVSLVSPSEVNAHQRERSLTPSEYDVQGLEKAAEALGAEVVVWGIVNQYTPYRFDRLAPATPPYVDVTLLAFRRGRASVAKVGGRKQGGLPGTIWGRQPTFEDVARPLIAEILSSIR